LRVSRNIPAVLLAEQAGMKTLERGWRDLGLDEASSNPSAALGSFGATPLELAGAYTVFPGGGRWSQPTLVRSALDERGALLWEQEPIRLRRTSAEGAWLVGSMLQDVVRSGTGAKASAYGATGNLGGKTGTTDGARDAWFVGYSAEYAVAVWVGFDRDRVLGLTGGQAALPTWARFMGWSGTGGTSFSRPAGLQFVEGCVACDPMGVCLDEDGEWFRSGQAPEVCGDDGIFGLQPGDESLWAVLQERIEARKAERSVTPEETRRERRRRLRGG
jgi:membrane peptidoglycan carboxypeptidase